ncbi:hypothetical protein GCM10028778_17710 [Barrientosiimonas marina]|uniref:DUF3298 domain-containing protein n=1 Tax=Lentibacillus kimchii TaxID=1542911 RepID=A0ABW2UWM1_9BACI
MLKGNKLMFLALALLAPLFLIGCQSNNLDLSDDVTEIEVFKSDSDELIAAIDDADFIDKLVNELDNARTKTTANIDYRSPDYELFFKNNDKTIFHIGYYQEVMDLGINGRYLDDDGLIYGAELQLPID